MKNKTAVEYLRERLFKEFGFAYSDNIHEEIKVIEREQIINAYDAGTFYLEGGLYYKEKFEENETLSYTEANKKEERIFNSKMTKQERTKDESGI